MNNNITNSILEDMIQLVELSDNAYEKAKDRYDSLGEWFNREESSLKDNEVHIFPQGSFRLGTAIKPLDSDEEYDLDLACNVRNNVSKTTHTQEDLKELVGIELEAYRKAKGIKENKSEKRRCWRLEYQDSPSFHMDIVPCIPLDESLRENLHISVEDFIKNDSLSENISINSLSITDKERSNYKKIDTDWHMSNPEGYAIWFEDKMYNTGILNQLSLEHAQVDNLPIHNNKTPLQRSIQLLKRHRDTMYKGKDDSKPISIIITTLATHAYSGELNLAEALKNILKNMDKYINPSKPKVPNPTNPKEDFADKWSESKYKHLQLEKNFYSWLEMARKDFGLLFSEKITNADLEFITERISLPKNITSSIAKKLGITSSIEGAASVNIKKEETASPWLSIK